MVLVSKIIAILFTTLVITKTFYDYKRHQESLTMLFFWTLTWLGIVYVAVMPGVFYTFVQNMSNENVGMGTFVGIAFIFLLFVTYRVYTKANRIEKQIHDLVMKLGLKEINDIDKK